MGLYYININTVLCSALQYGFVFQPLQEFTEVGIVVTFEILPEYVLPGQRGKPTLIKDDNVAAMVSCLNVCCEIPDLLLVGIH